MKTSTFFRRVELPVSAEDAFAWHERPGAFKRLVPPWEDVRLVQRTGSIRDGDRVELRAKAGPLMSTWLIEHHHYEAGRRFCDRALRSPFAYWEHEHRFEPRDSQSCVLEDRLEYALPGGFLGALLGAAYVRRKLARLFRYRHDTTREDLTLQQHFSDRPRWRIALSGASGLVGSALVSFLTAGGHEVQHVRRQAPNQFTLENPDVPPDAVIHLAGENIVGRWTQQKKARIAVSRIEGTENLCRTLLQWPRRPRVLISASAVGYYGSRGQQALDETSSPGEGFLSDVCRGWEKATESARRAGIRVVLLRLGMVLTPRGGALAQMLTPFRWGLGGRIGDGSQFMSWISLDDALGAMYYALMDERFAGPVNAVAPQPVTNAELTAALRRVLCRPALLPLPSHLVDLVFGQMGREVMLSSARVLPRRFIEGGYPFRHPRLETALRHLLGSTAP